MKKNIIEKVIQIVEKSLKYTVIRYIIGGGTSACVNLIFFYVFNSLFHIYYLYASVMAFVIAFCVSFLMHKFWTFPYNKEVNGGVKVKSLNVQGPLYLMTSLFGLGLDTGIFYVTVSLLHIHPLIIGKVIAGALTACCTFFISKNIVFKQNNLL